MVFFGKHTGLQVANAAPRHRILDPTCGNGVRIAVTVHVHIIALYIGTSRGTGPPEREKHRIHPNRLVTPDVPVAFSDGLDRLAGDTDRNGMVIYGNAFQIHIRFSVGQ